MSYILIFTTFFTLMGSVTAQAQKLDIQEMLFGEKPTHDLYDSKGPKWKDKMIEKNKVNEEDITKRYDEGENFYDAVLSCQENEGKTMEGFDAGDVSYEVSYKVLAMKSIQKSESRSETVAYVLVPLVKLTYSTDDTPAGECEVLEDDYGYVYKNDAKKILYLGRILSGKFEPAK